MSQNLNLNFKLLTLDFQLPGCQSLKEKRRRLGGLKDRFGKIPNLAVTESDHHDNHQLSQWTFVAIGNNANLLEKLFASVETHANTQLDAVIINCQRQWL
ncbi:MAG: DUF503 domain-containing protein [Psychrosphaera sp.]|nr:DUF503 domain-containing protein [Psychrosphaera sp.]